VENRSGAGGNMATAEVVLNKGEGHTILIANPAHAIAFSIYRN